MTKPSILTLPNLLTSFRFIAAPALLWLAWHGHGLAFMGLLALAFLTDVLDGWAARMMGQVSEFGAILDSCADVVNYLTIAVCCWWLWPEIVEQEWFYVALIIASCLLPTVFGLIKFGSFTCYHTWTVKAAAAAMGSSLFLMFLNGPIWPFRIAAILCIAAAIEEMAITFFLTEPRPNVRSLFNVLKSIRNQTRL